MRPHPKLLGLYASFLSARLERGDADPSRTQRRTLEALLARYRGTALGRLQGFDHAHGPEDFSRVVPISTAESTRELFERVHDENPPGAVAVGRLTYMAKCSGTSGIRKLVPYPPALIKAFKSFEMAIAMRHMHETRHPDML